MMNKATLGEQPEAKQMERQEKEDIHKIIDISLNKVFKRIQDLGYTIKLNDKAKDFIAEKGYDPSYGARPLNRAIQKYLEDPLAEEILKGEISEGDTLIADLNGDNNAIEFQVEKEQNKEPQ